MNQINQTNKNGKNENSVLQKDFRISIPKSDKPADIIKWRLDQAIAEKEELLQHVSGNTNGLGLSGLSTKILFLEGKIEGLNQVWLSIRD